MYGIATAAYQIIDWVDRVLFIRPRVVRRRVVGSGYVWTRSRPGDGAATRYPRPFWSPASARPDVTVREVSASDFFREGEDAADFFRQGARESRHNIRFFYGMARRDGGGELPAPARFELPAPAPGTTWAHSDADWRAVDMAEGCDDDQ